MLSADALAWRLHSNIENAGVTVLVLKGGRASIGVAFGYITNIKANRQSIKIALSVSFLHRQNCRMALPIHRQEVWGRYENIIYFNFLLLYLNEMFHRFRRSVLFREDECCEGGSHSAERRSCGTLLYGPTECARASM